MDELLQTLNLNSEADLISFIRNPNNQNHPLVQELLVLMGLLQLPRNTF